MPLATQAPIPQPLSTKFFADMLHLETLIQTHHDFKVVDELVQHYAVFLLWREGAHTFAFFFRKQSNTMIIRRMQSNLTSWKKFRSYSQRKRIFVSSFRSRKTGIITTTIITTKVIVTLEEFLLDRIKSK